MKIGFAKAKADHINTLGSQFAAQFGHFNGS